MENHINKYADYPQTSILLSLAIVVCFAGIICIGCTRAMPDATVPRPYEYDKQMWNSFVTQKAMVETASDQFTVLASGDFTAKWDDYSLTCRPLPQPSGTAPIKSESGKYYQSGTKTYLSPQSGSNWSFDEFPLPGSFFAFQMPITSGSTAIYFRWLPASELQQRQAGNWTIAARDEPLPVIADCRGDGIERRYHIDVGGIYERDSSGGASALYRITSLGGNHNPEFLTTGNCRGDGKTRLYSTDQGQNIIEIEYAAATWRSAIIASMPPPAVTPGPPGKQGYPAQPTIFDCLACADPRGEGRQSLYFGSGVYLYEERWTGALLVRSVVDSIPYYAVYLSGDNPRIVNAACGDIRGDGKPRLYYTARYQDVSCRYALVECEIDTGSAWHSQLIVPDLEPESNILAQIPMAILPVHTGNNGLLIALPNKTCEISYASGQWTKSEIVPMHASGIAGGAGRNDGVYRVYFTISDYQAGTANEILEYTCSGDVWTQTATIPGIPAPLGIVAGKGRGDGVVRLYAGRDLLTYEITWGTLGQ
jgi:hypothetical protein